MPDVSANPQFHVYRWNLSGVAYVQVNDIAGNVLVAFAAGGGQVLVLPIGNPANVSVVSPSVNAANIGSTVYNTATINVTQRSGVFSVSNSQTPVHTQAMMYCPDPGECTAVEHQLTN
ncbi:hypothetical protein [Dyella sp. M7H15-1]|uniref:hypothetical protein n=1 Tax=Dyella sp. M7H15-1 TaxID=2501295 RepID=UPI0013E8B5B2|nr:hypothetical protein [Dyella sp. M7H15-1]